MSYSLLSALGLAVLLYYIFCVFMSRAAIFGLGIGMVSSVRAANTSVGIGLTQHRFNPANQGIFSVVMQFGFQALILTGFICYRMFRGLRFVILNERSDIKVISISIQLYLMCRIVGFSHIFLWEPQGIWWGLLFFMTWKMRDITEQTERLKFVSK